MQDNATLLEEKLKVSKEETASESLEREESDSKAEKKALPLWTNGKPAFQDNSSGTNSRQRLFEQQPSGNYQLIFSH